MTPTGFDYTVRAVFKIVEADIDFLIELSKLHYDLKCKSIGVPGPGAFLWGMKNSVGEDGVAEGRLGSDEINLILKVLELRLPSGTRVDLVDEFVALFRAVQAEDKRLNTLNG